MEIQLEWTTPPIVAEQLVSLAEQLSDLCQAHKVPLVLFMTLNSTSSEAQGVYTTTGSETGRITPRDLVCRALDHMLIAKKEPEDELDRLVSEAFARAYWTLKAARPDVDSKT
jgi:hypothetical protein